VYGVRSLRELRRGFTFEAGIGLGLAFSHDNDAGTTSDTNTIAALGVGVAYFITPDLAIGIRSTGTFDTETKTYNNVDGSTYDVTTVVMQGVIGPSAQFWLPNRVWLGGGLGWGFGRVISTSDSPGSDAVGAGFNGFGVNARAGYTLTRSSTNTVNIQVEMTAGFWRRGYLNAGSAGGANFDVSTNAYSFALLVGYQHL
jgi:hypothetical protein